MSQNLNTPAPEDHERPETPEQLNDANQPPVPPRPLDKPQVCSMVGVSYPTVWDWMRKGAFPRSRIVGGRSMWLSAEVDTWMTGLPVRQLKGDFPPPEVA